MKRIPALLAALAFAPVANAADLGGNCCADLEERIAELEATTARKGNRKMSVTLYGEVNQAIVAYDAFGESDAVIGNNGNSTSRFGFKGEAKVSESFKAGYVLEVGVGSGDLLTGFDNDLVVRHSAAYVGTPVGTFWLGQTSQATDGIAELTTANTVVAAKMLAFDPVLALSPWDGSREQLVKWDSPSIGGFVVSASWTPESVDDTFDVALRYAGEFSGFKAAAGIGYKTEGDGAVTTLSGSASLMHVASGVFVSAAAGDLEIDSWGLDVWGYHGQAGVERNWFGYGRTTLFAEWMQVEEVELDVYGAGIVQAVDAAALDLYLTGRRYAADAFGDEDPVVVTAGARVRF